MQEHYKHVLNGREMTEAEIKAELESFKSHPDWCFDVLRYELGSKLEKVLGTL